jgi:hypothetical protein
LCLRDGLYNNLHVVSKECLEERQVRAQY